MEGKREVGRKNGKEVGEGKRGEGGGESGAEEEMRERD